MVKGAVITTDFLSDIDQEERDEALQETYGVTEEELEEIRSSGTYKNKIKKGAELLSEKGYGDRITCASLAALAYSKWEKPQNHKRYVGTAIGREYGEEREALERNLDLNLTNIHMLRKEADAYQGNLGEARRIYSEFENSDRDLLRSIQLPLDIGVEEGQLLGCFWSEGGFREVPENETDYFMLQGEEDDQEWYNMIQERAQDVFNLDVEAGVYTDRAKGESFLSADRDFPMIIVGSKTVNSWIKDDLGFDEEIVPDIDWDFENKAGFLSGFTSGGGHITSDEQYEISSRDEEEIRKLNEFFSDIGIDSGVYKYDEQNRLQVQKADTQKLLNSGFFWNPKFEQKI